MPKQTLNINKFDGGMNTESDPRDIAENQLALLSGCYVDKRGIIRTSSSSAAEGLTAQDLGHYLEGSGFYSFGADYEWDGTQNSDAYFHVINDGEDLFIYDGGDASPAWKATASGTSDTVNVNKWLNDDKDLELGETAKNATDPVYHFAENALRVSDANFSNTTNYTQWIGAIDRSLFDPLNAGGSSQGLLYHTGSGWATASHGVIPQAGWFIEDQYIRPPFAKADCGDGNARNIWYSDGSNITEHNHADHWQTSLHGGSVAFTVQQANAGTISESLKTKWYMGVSYIYDGNDNGCEGQESSITVVRDEYNDYANAQQFDFSAYDYPAMIMAHFTREHDQDDNYYWNPRVTGMRVYISEKDTGASSTARNQSNSTWLRIADIDMNNGRWSQFCHGSNAAPSNANLLAIGNADGSTAHQIVTAHPSIGNYLSTASTQTIHWGICLAELPAESYYSLNGFKNNSLIDIKYKTSTILNRSTYIGNIYDVTNSQAYGDRIMKTPQGKYDTFSTNFFIDVVPGDGDSIIKLESFGDRLFVFKERALYIVNVSQGDEFIEGEYQGMGIDKRRHAVKSEFGIIWINQNGVFHFDGSKINNLSDALIKSDWEAFFSTDASIGYDLKSKHLIIDCDIDNGTTDFTFNAFGLSSGDSNHGHALVYDFKIKAWTFLNGYFATGENRSNMVISSKDQKLMWYQQSETEAVKTYNDTSAAQTIDIHTKDFDFGNPAVRKKIYKVYVSYKGDASAVTCTYAINGDTDTVANFYKSGADGTTTGATDSTTPFHSSGVGVDDWVRAELKPVASINNIFSFALQFGGTAEADFQINDITIVYRGKNIK